MSCGDRVVSGDMTNDCLILITFGRQEYVEIPLEKLAFPYGTPDRSRYLERYCTDEVISVIEQGYKGIGYYFLRVIKQDGNHLIPLRKLEIQRTEMPLGEQVIIDYNVTDYAWSDTDPARIFQVLKQPFEIERTSDKEILVFSASKNTLSSLIKTGKDRDSWGDTVKPIKELVLGTDVMNADKRNPLLICSILTDDKEGSQITQYDKDGIKVNPETGYRVSLVLRPLKDVSGFGLPVEMKADESLITPIKSKGKFVAWYDRVELFFTTRKWDNPVYTEATIAFSPKDQFCVADTELRLKLAVRKWATRGYYAMFAVGALFISFATYSSKLVAEQPLWTIILTATAGTFLTTFALIKLRR